MQNVCCILMFFPEDRHLIEECDFQITDFMRLIWVITLNMAWGFNLTSAATLVHHLTGRTTSCKLLRKNKQALLRSNINDYILVTLVKLIKIPLNQLYLEKGHGGSIPHCPVFNPGLLCQVVRWVDGRIHSLHGEEGSQVGSVGGDDD